MIMFSLSSVVVVAVVVVVVDGGVTRSLLDHTWHEFS